MMEQATILLVDDDKVLRGLLEKVLVESGYGVLSAANAVQALQLANLHDDRIDLLLSDMRMPDMDGPELAAEFRRIIPHAKVIFLTAYLKCDARKRAPNEMILTKPFCIDALCESIRRQLHSTEVLTT